MDKEQNIADDNNEMFEHFHFVVDKGQRLLRIDKYLFEHIENISRNRIQVAAKAGSILVNKKPVKQNYKVKPKDVISIVMSHPPRDIEIIAENIPLEILYEDKDVIVINKKAGMVVHPGHGNYTGTLVNALTYYLREVSPDKKPDAKPFLVHRIDKDTSGVLLIAKNEIAQTKLGKQFYDHSIDRKYNALVWGDFDKEEGTVNGNIGRSLKNRLVMSVFPDGDYGKEAVTHYKVLKRFGYVTLIECKLETGRTHQIRAHMKYIGHPLFNDARYGGNSILKGTSFSKYRQFIINCFKLMPRQGLHAKSLAFIHPSTNKLISFESDFPKDMKDVLEKWDSYSSFNKSDF